MVRPDGIEGVQAVRHVVETRQPMKNAPEGAQRRGTGADQKPTASTLTVSNLDRASAAHLRASARDEQGMRWCAGVPSCTWTM